jgi:hypothetical protein
MSEDLKWCGDYPKFECCEFCHDRIDFEGEHPIELKFQGSDTVNLLCCRVAKSRMASFIYEYHEESDLFWDHNTLPVASE